MSLRVPCKKQLAKGPLRQTHNLCIVIQCCRYVAAGKESASQFDPTYFSYSSQLIKTKEDNLYVFHNQGKQVNLSEFLYDDDTNLISSVILHPYIW